MGHIQVRENRSEPIAPVQRATPWEPSAWLGQATGWAPYRDRSMVLEEKRLPFMPASFMPAFEVTETADTYSVKADVPGIEEAELELSLSGRRLTVSGRREAEKAEKADATYHTCERPYGSFTRSFTLPEAVNIQAIHADLANGVLSVVLPKTPDAQPRKIPIANGPRRA